MQGCETFGCSEEFYIQEEMTEQRNKSFLKELEERTASSTDTEFERFERFIMERRGRAAAPATAAPIGAAPAQPTSTGVSCFPKCQN